MAVIEIMLPLASLLVLVGLHLVLMRTTSRLLPVQALTLAGLLAVLLLIAAEAVTALLSGAPATYLSRHAPANLVTHVCLAYAYFHAFNLSETGRRIRILIELENAGGLTADDLLARYNAAEVLERRLDRLRQAGQIEIRDGRLYPNKRVLCGIGRIVLLLRRIVEGERCKTPRFDDKTAE